MYLQDVLTSFLMENDRVVMIRAKAWAHGGQWFSLLVSMHVLMAEAGVACGDWGWPECGDCPDLS